MNFVKIELRGFKSFADKVEIPFKEGVTAIIGPNGCGKSNVADAIRWTLGEQSAKTLRGKNMQDVIFAGTEKRKSMSYCEVSLHFDNSEHTLFPSLPYDSVVITRKLDRSGLSEYFINNTRCRMKDIVTLFHDTGIGKEGYSIIGQGRIAEIMSAKPDDRRNIFEEAAGISKFRAQREEAERRLEKTAINLQTASEVIGEIERQLVPLKRQADNALKFFDLRDQLKSQEVNLYIYNFENNQNIKQKIYDRLAVAERELKIKNEKYNTCVQQYERCLSDRDGVDRLSENYTAELMALKVNAEKASGEVNVLKEKIGNLQSEKNRLNDELKSVDSQLATYDLMISSSENKKTGELTSYLSTSKELEDASKKLSLLSTTLKGQESDLETRNLEYVQAIEQLGALKGNLSGFIAEKGINEERSKNIMSLLGDKKAQLDAEITNLSIYEGKLKSAKETLRNLSAEYNEALSNKMDANEAIKGYQQDIISLNSRLGASIGNLDLLVKIKNEYSGYQPAVKALMNDAKYDENLDRKVLGVLAEVLKVSPEYETAIEYALGGALQNVLVENERDASELITYLKQKNYGRITFRPLTSCRPHTLEGRDRDVLKEDGCYGLASDLVECDKKFDPFVETLLGTTVVVDNMVNAIRIFKKYNQSFKIVTVEGEIFSRGGEITGGSRKNQKSGIMSQEKDIEQARASLERLKSQIADLNAERVERENEVASCDSAIVELNKSIQELRIECGLNEDKSKQAREITERLTAEVQRDAAEYEVVRNAIKDISSKIGNIDELEKLVKDKQIEYGSSLETSKSKSSEQKNEFELMNESVMSLRLKLAGHKSALDGCDADLFRLGHDRQGVEDEKMDLIADLKIVESNLEAISSAPEKKKFSPEDLARIKLLESEVAGLSNKKKSLSDDIGRLDAEKNNLNTERNTINEKKIRDEGMLENVDIEIRHQQEHILEEYSLTYTDSLQFRDEEFKQYGALTVIADLKKAISKLGEVNTLAVETLKETEERYNECVLQRDDIQAGYDDIMKVIEELTGEMTNKFTDAFDKINANFREVFAELFGGGKGELRLNTEETDDPLEAGIEILAQPPGKKLKSINLLSGGEQALTAISILFAILKVKPMPFCVLDEIEAALDDANANLFADFLKKFSASTQFIVITHRKPTMQHADNIFGVTMEEKGVTHIVSVTFEDAINSATEDD